MWWHYTVTLGAAQDAQLYLAQTPYSILADIMLAPAAAAAANDIMTAELVELKPGDYPVYHGVYCDSGACVGYTVSDTLQAWTQQAVQDPLYAHERADRAGQPAGLPGQQQTGVHERPLRRQLHQPGAGAHLRSSKFR